jgi:hypothetical protein
MDSMDRNFGMVWKAFEAKDRLVARNFVTPSHKLWEAYDNRHLDRDGECDFGRPEIVSWLRVMCEDGAASFGASWDAIEEFVTFRKETVDLIEGYESGDELSSALRRDIGASIAETLRNFMVTRRMLALRGLEPEIDLSQLHGDHCLMYMILMTSPSSTDFSERYRSLKKRAGLMLALVRTYAESAAFRHRNQLRDEIRVELRDKTDALYTEVSEKFERESRKSDIVAEELKGLCFSAAMSLETIEESFGKLTADLDMQKSKSEEMSKVQSVFEARFAEQTLRVGQLEKKLGDVLTSLRTLRRRRISAKWRLMRRNRELQVEIDSLKRSAGATDVAGGSFWKRLRIF